MAVIEEKYEVLMEENKDLEKAAAHKANYIRFSKEDIERGISEYSSLLLGEGVYGHVYKGKLLNTDVAIKKAKGKVRADMPFQMEIDILCKVKHPNIVTLMGACPEERTIVYEYLPGGTLDDRLNCRVKGHKTLGWKDRMHIASEICTALSILHTQNPPIVHGDLKPTNILFDANDVLKLADFGTSRVLQRPKDDPQAAFVHVTLMAEGTPGYMDPLIRQTYELTVQSDVYAFGKLLLFLLTTIDGRVVCDKVKSARQNRRLNKVLDSTAKWPTKVAEGLCDLALECCEIDMERRPDLASHVRPTLKRLRGEHKLSGFSVFRKRG